MSGELGRDEVDLTESAEVASAMSAAVGRLRQLAAAAFNAGCGAAGEATPSSSGPTP